jgi:hypothetical protein
VTGIGYGGADDWRPRPGGARPGQGGAGPGGRCALLGRVRRGRRTRPGGARPRQAGPACAAGRGGAAGVWPRKGGAGSG